MKGVTRRRHLIAIAEASFISPYAYYLNLGCNLFFFSMSGHSKWAQIHRQKGVADTKRGALFTRIELRRPCHASVHEHR